MLTGAHAVTANRRDGAAHIDCARSQIGGRRKRDREAADRELPIAIKIRQPIEAFRVAQIHFPAQPQIQCQPIVYLPIVLREKGVVQILHRWLWHHRQPPGVRIAEQQRRDGIAGLRVIRRARRERAREREVARRIVRPIVVDAIDALIRAQLEGMRAEQQTQILIERKGVLIIQRIAKIGCAR